jgi:hypothetical protein
MNEIIGLLLSGRLFSKYDKTFPSTPIPESFPKHEDYLKAWRDVFIFEIFNWLTVGVSGNKKEHNNLSDRPWQAINVTNYRRKEQFMGGPLYSMIKLR